jgi:hypothetical protein
VACRDERHKFTLRHPQDWRPTGPPGRCVQFLRGEPSLPEVTPEVDVFVRIVPLEDGFPAEYMRPDIEPGGQRFQVGRGVTYSDRRELAIAGLPAVRARFRSAGPTPNWGVEYAIRKGDRILDAYISQPSPEIEAEFDAVIGTLEW